MWHCLALQEDESEEREEEEQQIAQTCPFYSVTLACATWKRWELWFKRFLVNYRMERFIHYLIYGTRVTFHDPVVIFREQEWATRERDLAQLEWLVRERGESLGSLFIRCFLGVVLFKKCHGKNDRIPAEKRRQFRLYRLRCAIPALLLLRMLMRQRQSFHSASRFIIRRDHRI